MKIEELELLELTPAMLWLGPDLEQMAQAAVRALRRHGVVKADLVAARHLGAAGARSLAAFAQTAPFGPFKAAVAVLDGASAQAQNILLKVLEEPPLLGSGEPAIRFILVATARPLPTIVSRCQVITVPGEDSSPVAGGRVSTQVTAALNAASAGDLRALDTALAGWGDVQHGELEAQLTRTALSGADARQRWDARRMLGALGRFAGAQPRLAAHAALITVLSNKEQHA